MRGRCFVFLRERIKLENKSFNNVQVNYGDGSHAVKGEMLLFKEGLKRVNTFGIE